MANLKDIRDRIKSVKSIQKVTKAMKMVAAAKMRRAQERMEESRPYSNSMAEVIQHLLPDIDRDALPLLDVRDVKRKAYVVVSADRGLAGALNTNLLKITTTTSSFNIYRHSSPIIIYNWLSYNTCRIFMIVSR